jgi:hypothetical protein
MEKKPDVALIDLNYAVDGYLFGPGGCHVRLIHGLEPIARDTMLLKARVVWGALPGRELGISYCWSRVIVLANSLFDLEGWTIRSVWSHELAHCIVGQSHVRALAWQRAYYGDAVQPEIWMA